MIEVPQFRKILVKKRAKMKQTMNEVKIVPKYSKISRKSNLTKLVNGKDMPTDFEKYSIPLIFCERHLKR